MIDNHDDLVNAFFQKVKKERPEEYERVCEKYPIIQPWNQRAIDKREIPSGLITQENDE